MRLPGFLVAAAAAAQCASAVQLFSREDVGGDVSDQCLDALTADVNCQRMDTLDIQNIDINTVPELLSRIGGFLPEICTDACHDALDNYVDGLRRSCTSTDRLAIAGLPFTPVEVGGIHLVLYNIMCLRDENDEFCLSDPRVFADITEGEECSTCRAQVLAHILSMDLLAQMPQIEEVRRLAEECEDVDPSVTADVTSILVLPQPTETGTGSAGGNGGGSGGNGGGSVGGSGDGDGVAAGNEDGNGNPDSGAMKVYGLSGGVIAAAVFAGFVGALVL